MEQLARLRELKGFSQRALAKESGVSPATIYELENGRRRPNPSTLRKLAGALDVQVADLLGAEHPKAGAPPSLFNGLEEERREESLGAWKHYVRERVTWCEEVLGKSPDNDFNNPLHTSLDTAIQWWIYVDFEFAMLRKTIRAGDKAQPDEE